MTTYKYTVTVKATGKGSQSDEFHEALAEMLESGWEDVVYFQREDDEDELEVAVVCTMELNP